MFMRKPGRDSEPRSRTASLPPDIPTSLPSASSSASRAAPSRPAQEAEIPFEEGLVVIGRGTRVNGRISDCRTLDVHGIIEADVVTEKLIVREGGGIKGTVQTDSAEVHGVLEGTLTVHEYLDIRRTAQVTGDVEYRRLAIEDGAQVRGTIMCSEAPGAVAPADDLEDLDRTVVPWSSLATHHKGAPYNGVQYPGSQHHPAGDQPGLQTFMPIPAPSAGFEKPRRQTH